MAITRPLWFDPLVKAMLADRAWPMLYDLLLEEQATLQDMAVLFAGSRPDYEDGLPREWLVRWLECTGDGIYQDLVATIMSYQVLEYKDNAIHYWHVNALASPRFLTPGRAERDIKQRILYLDWARNIRVDTQADIRVLEKMPVEELERLHHSHQAMDADDQISHLWSLWEDFRRNHPNKQLHLMGVHPHLPITLHVPDIRGAWNIRQTLRGRDLIWVEDIWTGEL